MNNNNYTIPHHTIPYDGLMEGGMDAWMEGSISGSMDK